MFVCPHKLDRFQWIRGTAQAYKPRLLSIESLTVTFIKVFKKYSFAWQAQAAEEQTAPLATESRWEKLVFKLFIEVSTVTLTPSRQTVGGIEYIEKSGILSTSRYTTERETANRQDGNIHFILLNIFNLTCSTGRDNIPYT